ncbi:MAG: DUF418 domain-containing protein [Kineosporiaceae bacterium]
MSAAPSAAATARTAGDRDRQAFPDQLRGLALLGIVLVNAPFLGASLGGFGALGGVSAQTAEVAVTVLAQGKFYLIFAFLLGYSATFMLRTGDLATVRRSRRRWARRLVGLAVVGVGHALLFFVGDILVLYAVLGVVLLVVHRRRDRVLLGLAAVAAGLTAAWFAALVALAAVAPAGGGEVLSTSAYDAAMRGGFAETVAGRRAVYPEVLVALGLVLNGGLSLVAVLAGFVAGRRRLLADPGAHPRLRRSARRWGLLVGVPGAVVAGVLVAGPADPAAAAAHQESARYLAGVLLGFLTAPALSAGYVGALAALAARRPRALAVFAPAGRMSLSLYIGESVLLAAVFCGWGLGLFGRLDPWAVLGVGVAAWLVLDIAAHVWSRVFRQGPLELLLRWWTHGERPAVLAGRR